MAADMFTWIPSFLFLFVLTNLSGESWAQSSNLTTGNATLSSTTPSIVSTTSEELSSTLVPPKPLPRNTDIGRCPCDLTVKACDVNCCCDPDCSAKDRTTFTECITFNSIVDNRLCFQDNIFFAVNSILRLNKTSDGILCIYYDNYPSRNFYQNPDLITSDAVFQVYTRNYSSPLFQQPPQKAAEFAEFYKSGDPIWIIYGNGYLDFLRLPAAMTFEYCADSNPASYLFDQTFQCVRDLPNLSAECEITSALKASTYFRDFRIISSPGIFQDWNVTFEDIMTDLIKDLYESNSTLTFTNITLCKNVNCRLLSSFNNTELSPTYDGNKKTCYDVVEKVFYEITYEGTAGIVSIDLKLHLIDIKEVNYRLTQTFATEFRQVQIDEKVPLKKSGNPGYVLSEPIMAGTLERLVVDQKTVLMIKMNQNRNNWLTLPQSAPSGECSKMTRVSITFGQDIHTGCFIKVSDDEIRSLCQQLQNRTTNILLGNSVNTHVASFGNTPVKDVGDWVPILGITQQPQLLPFTNGYCSLSLGLQIQIIFSRVGSISNPQSKILGVAYNFDQRRNVYSQCPGVLCQVNSQQHLLEIIASVSYYDASQPVVEVIAEPPIYQLGLPYDFFYPFVSNSALEKCSSTQAMTIFLFGFFLSAVF